MEKHQKKTVNSSIVGAVIAALCIVIYLCALVQASVRLYLNIDRNKQTAEYEFSLISDIALAAGTQDFMDQRFIDTMNSALTASKSLEAMIISGPDNEYAFEKQRGRAVQWVNNSPRFINRISLSNQTHYRSLPIPNLRNANIKAVASAFDYNEFSKILKETLLMILVGFAVSFFTMLIQTLICKQNDTFSNYSYNKRKTDPRSDLSKPADVEISFDDDINTESTGNEPKGLYSPRSSIGWEEYTKDRLDSELHRCSSTEKDLSFLSIEFTDLTNDDMFKQSVAEAVSFFSERDLIFESGRWGITIIIPGTNLEAAITRSEKFYQRIMEKFPRGYKRSSSLCIGITSRSGRLVNADRLMLEAREALKKAKADPDNSIIAFKSDPEKYREFIRKRKL